MSSRETEDSTREKILQTAGPIFASCGYGGATVRQICSAANVNLASVNYYFGDKSKLYLETVKLAREMRTAAAPPPSWPIETPPQTKLYEFIHSLLRRLMAMQSAPWQVQLIMREVLEPTDACRHLVEEYFRPEFDRLLLVIDELVDRPVGDQERTRMGFSVIGQCLFYRYAGHMAAMFIDRDGMDGGNASTDDGADAGRQAEIESLAEYITGFCLAGFRGPEVAWSKYGQKVNWPANRTV